MRRILLLVLVAVPIYGKSLLWRSIDVQARLDGDGNLHVVEQQQIVFDGDWNGGERTFHPRGRQRIDVRKVTRIEDGRAIDLERGDVESVDHYEFSNGRILRWRSRLPSDPPFENQLMTYRIEYTYRNALVGDGNGFLLDHDFGLPDASGPIEIFTLKLQFDPVWKTAPLAYTREGLSPGEGMPVLRSLVHADGMKPRAYNEGNYALIAFAVGVALLLYLFVRAERSTGRFARVEPRLDSAVLGQNAEVVGAIWDASVGPPEVAAMLARMTQEKKIRTRVEGKELFMHLDGRDFSGYERPLIGKLFFDGDETDTKRIRAHYKTQGVDFAELVRPGIESAITGAVPGWNEKKLRFKILPHVLSLIASALFLAGLAYFGDREDVGEILVILVFGALFGLIASAVAWSRSRAITNFLGAFAGPAVLLMFPAGLLALGALRAYPNGRMSLAALIGCTIWLLLIVRLTLDMLKTRESNSVIAARKDVLALREFFVEQLRMPQPALRDEWFPHLLAFGLGKHADRWFRSFGGAADTMAFTASSSSSTSSSSSPSWSGGGGAFGGAGATGSWAVAAAAVGAGVAAPSSSGGGGGGGGGSSSGGGGGGGW